MVDVGKKPSSTCELGGRVGKHTKTSGTNIGEKKLHKRSTKRTRTEGRKRNRSMGDGAAEKAHTTRLATSNEGENH